MTYLGRVGAFYELPHEEQVALMAYDRIVRPVAPAKAAEVTPQDQAAAHALKQKIRASQRKRQG